MRLKPNSNGVFRIYKKEKVIINGNVLIARGYKIYVAQNYELEMVIILIQIIYDFF